MGDLASTISNVISSAGNIASDPYLPEVTCLIGQLSAIKSGQTPGACNQTPDGLPGGVGLSDAVKPLRWYVYAKQNPWVFPAAVFAVIGLPFLIGYTIGKDSGS